MFRSGVKKMHECISENHRRWLETPGKGGRAHVDNPMLRKFSDPSGKYHNKWEGLLGL